MPKLKIKPLPRIWSEGEKVHPELRIPSFGRDYKISLTDSSFINPFILDREILGIAHTIAKTRRTDIGKAKEAYDWLTGNVKYGASKRANGYRNSGEVMADQEGVCGEMSFLYIAMARAVGVRSNYVSVTVDNTGREVAHACASVGLEQGLLLVDPAYRACGILHKKYEILDDSKAIERYQRWKG